MSPHHLTMSSCPPERPSSYKPNRKHLLGSVRSCVVCVASHPHLLHSSRPGFLAGGCIERLRVSAHSPQPCSSPRTGKAGSLSPPEVHPVPCLRPLGPSIPMPAFLLCRAPATTRELQVRHLPCSASSLEGRFCEHRDPPLPLLPTEPCHRQEDWASMALILCRSLLTQPLSGPALLAGDPLRLNCLLTSCWAALS